MRLPARPANVCLSVVYRHAALALLWLTVAVGCGDDITLRLLEREPSGSASSSSGGSAGSGGLGAGGGSTAAGAPSIAGDALIHRYDFAGSGTTLADRAGTADGRLEGGAELDGEGGALLDGRDDFASLPPGLISSLDEVTLLAWLTWNDSPCWQRVFDIGSQITGSEGLLVAETSLFLAPEGCGSNRMVASIELPNFERYGLEAAQGLPAGRPLVTGVVVDTSSAELKLVLDGSVIGREPMPRPLSLLRDSNVWLGRSQYEHDRFLNARLDEFRVYARALTDSELSAIFEAGPDML